MSVFCISPEAETVLDDMWLRVARESGGVDLADRVVDNIAERFWLLQGFPYLGRTRYSDLRSGLRSLIADDYVIIHRIEEDDTVLILPIVHSSRDLTALFRN